MYPLQHLFFGIIFSLILFFLFPQIGFISLGIIILSSVLIDVDHYLWYIHKKKDYNPKNAYNWFVEVIKKGLSFPRGEREFFYSGFCFLHGIEFLFILSIFRIFISEFFLFIFLGIALHLLFDVVDETTYHDRIDKFSIFYDFFKFKKLRYIDDL